MIAALACVSCKSIREGSPSISRMNRDGSSPVQLTTNAGMDYDPDWAKKALSQ